MKKSKCIAVMLLATFLLAPKLDYIDTTPVPLLLLCAIALLFGWTNPEANERETRTGLSDSLFGTMVFTWTGLCGIATLSAIFNNSFSFEIIAKPIRQVLLVLTIQWLVRTRVVDATVALASTVVAGTVNSCVLLMQFLGPQYGYSDTILQHPGMTNEVIFRKAGLVNGYPIAGLVALFAIGAGFMLFFTSTRKSMYIILFIPNLVALFLTSRTALLAAAIFLSIVLVQAASPQLIIVITVAAVAIGILIFSGVLGDTFSDHSLPFALEFFDTSAGKNGFEAESLTELIASLGDVPTRVSTWALGNASLNFSDTGKWVDSGYYLWIYQYGLLGSLAIAGIAAALVFPAYQSLEKKERIVYSGLIAVLLLSHVKGSIIFSRVVGDALVLTSIALIRRRDNGDTMPKDLSRLVGVSHRAPPPPSDQKPMSYNRLT